MNPIDLVGWTAAALTLLAFSSRDVRRLRLASVGASLAFIVFGAATSAWPVLALHLVLLPVNLWRLGGDWVPRRRVGLLVVAGTAALVPGSALPASQGDRLHARAVELFRQGQFPHAYGRFVGLANAGHPASAQVALWMCEQGPALFGREWDCAPHEVEDWRRSAATLRTRPAAGEASCAPGLPRLLVPAARRAPQ